MILGILGLQTLSKRESGGLAREATVNQVASEGKDRKIEDRVDADGDAEEATEGRAEGLVLCGSDHFRDFQAGGKN